MDTHRAYLPAESIDRIFDAVIKTYTVLSELGMTGKTGILMGSLVLYDARRQIVIAYRDFNKELWPERSNYRRTVERKMELSLKIGQNSEACQSNPVLWEKGDCEWAGFVLDKESLLGFGFSGDLEMIDVVLCEHGLSLCRAEGKILRYKEGEENTVNKKKRPGTIGDPWK